MPGGPQRETLLEQGALRQLLLAGPVCFLQASADALEQAGQASPAPWSV